MRVSKATHYAEERNCRQEQTQQEVREEKLDGRFGLVYDAAASMCLLFCLVSRYCREYSCD